MEMLTQSIITLIIGGFFGGLIKSLIDYRSQVFSHLWDNRLAAYKELWKLTKQFPRWPKAKDVTYKKLYEASIAFKDWYFDNGGILMSKKTRIVYGKLQEEINDRILSGKKEDEKIIDDTDYNLIQELCSTLRGEMTNDLLSRQKQI